MTSGTDEVTTRFADVNGTRIAYRVQGDGPPLVLIMGYRLNSTAWPATFIEQLARRFTVVTLDNRGTGLSDKPVAGYAIANMARDVRGLLDELGFAEVHLLGYSMGGAIAQEFVRQFPARVKGLILCATMAGGPSATYAGPSVIRVMRDLDGLTPEQAARRIWTVTYAPGYLARHTALAEEQMQREIARPTPLHAADLQFQAFAEFDCSHVLGEIRQPTLVLTGDLDRLVSPQNSYKMAPRIPGATLTVIPGGGHRVLWEATDECVAHIAGFLESVDEPRHARNATPTTASAPPVLDTLMSATEWLARWPATLAGAAADNLTIARQSMVVGNASRFGDGKPIVLVPPFLGSDLSLLPLSFWLKSLGYRPAGAGLFLNLGDPASDRLLARSIRDITARVGRKVVLIAHSTGFSLARRVAESHRDQVSDIIALAAPRGSKAPDGIRTRFIASRWPLSHAMLELPQLLRSIDMQLLGAA